MTGDFDDSLFASKDAETLGKEHEKDGEFRNLHEGESTRKEQERKSAFVKNFVIENFHGAPSGIDSLESTRDGSLYREHKFHFSANR